MKVRLYFRHTVRRELTTRHRFPAVAAVGFNPSVRSKPEWPANAERLANQDHKLKPDQSVRSEGAGRGCELVRLRFPQMQARLKVVLSSLQPVRRLPDYTQSRTRKPVSDPPSSTSRSWRKADGLNQDDCSSFSLHVLTRHLVTSVTRPCFRGLRRRSLPNLRPA